MNSAASMIASKQGGTSASSSAQAHDRRQTKADCVSVDAAVGSCAPWRVGGLDGITTAL
jgi:hypothetical protein